MTQSPANSQDLSGKDAIDKLRSLTENSPTCMLGTELDRVPMQLCPMQVQEVDDLGCIWFFSGADSKHNKILESDPRTQLVFCNPSKIEYLTVYGQTTIVRDRAKAEQLWNKFAEAYFPEGITDPNLTLLRVLPIQSHFWDTENGKLVTYARILISAVSGGKMDEGGIEGELKV
jgi:general stress protein 26